MRRRVAIVADDLTGATDTGVQFAHAGWSSELLLEEFSAASLRSACSAVVAVTTDSRAGSADVADARVRHVIAAAREAGFDRLYKKVDSTLRGPVRAEVEAARQAWADDAIAVVCPAFPAAGRTVRDGVLLVDGVPVGETALARDPVTPVTESHIPTLLGGAHVRPASDGDAGALAEALRAAGPLVVVDASTEGDLLQLGRAIDMLGAQALPVGAAGLAAALADTWQQGAPGGPLLVLVSSQNPASLAQAEALGQRRSVLAVTAPADIAPEVWMAWRAELLSSVERGAADGSLDVVLVLAPPRHAELDPARVSALLGQAVARVATAHDVRGLVLVGGDGARSTLEFLGARGIELHRQLDAGVPLGVVVGGDAEGTQVVTKAGGFGGPSMLVDIAERLRESEAAR